MTFRTGGTSGLGGVADEVGDIEHHFHTVERWYGAGASLTTLSGYTLTSGDNNFGTAAGLLAPVDTPAIAGRTNFDVHRIKVVATSEDDEYRLRLIFGISDAATALAANQYTEVVFMFDSLNPQHTDVGPVEMMIPIVPAGTLLWGQLKNATNLATVEIFIGIHEYDPDFSVLV